MKALTAATGGERVSVPRWVLDVKEEKLRAAHEQIHKLNRQLVECGEAFAQVRDERDSARRERDHAHRTIAALREQLGGAA